MKPKGIRLLANLILWIGVVLGLAACVFVLLLAQGNPLKIPTEYVPGYIDFIIIGAFVLVILVTAIVLHAVAGRKEKRDRIRAAWEGTETPAEAAAEIAEEIDPVVEVADAIDAEEPIIAEDAEEVAEEAAEEVAEEPATKKGKIKALRAKLTEKVSVNKKKIIIAGVVAIATAVPAAIAGAVVGKQHAQLKAYKKKEARRKEFYNWLG